MNWLHDEQYDHWTTGTPTLGAKVYQDAPLAGDDWEWYGDVTTPTRGSFLIGPFSCANDAKKCAEDRLNEYQETTNALPR